MGCGMSKNLNVADEHTDKINNNHLVVDVKQFEEKSSESPNIKQKTVLNDKNINEIMQERTNCELGNTTSNNKECTNKFNGHTNNCNGSNHSLQSNSMSNCTSGIQNEAKNEQCGFIEIKSNQPTYNKLNETRLQRLQAKKYNSSTIPEQIGIEQSMSSPFGQRKTLTLSESQVDFFRMLDEKIAQGKDYCSEDERSISSLLSRKSRSISNGSHTTFMSLRSQHVR